MCECLLFLPERTGSTFYTHVALPSRGFVFLDRVVTEHASWALPFLTNPQCSPTAWRIKSKVLNMVFEAILGLAPPHPYFGLSILTAPPWLIPTPASLRFSSPSCSAWNRHLYPSQGQLPRRPLPEAFHDPCLLILMARWQLGDPYPGHTSVITLATFCDICQFRGFPMIVGSSGQIHHWIPHL